MASGGKGENILVSVRVRPRNEKEKARHDVCDWECVNNTTIICNNNLPERSLFPSTYTFDKVFGFDSLTKQVYEDGAKEVALCVLDGINSSIFAYGQTSSGKTYTMSGITEFAIEDIFHYIEMHKEREFTLKFSAIEIYNEAVRDLLSGDNNQLRLLDDPERGTVVEKLIEETLRDRIHLQELLSICETQRKIGETSMNETSSRSHQILRLTIESSCRDYSPENSSTLAASVCFVDLAGSERASQTLSAGTRLKEGCHINRSLLTLGTVIRKLSKGKNGHVPYRDSKITRILQNSLGGNARTAIICTMSPARSHVEQSRNTLLFATCSKEVTTNAKVNMVVSEKALVRQLQQELARMENELKTLGSASSAGSDFYSMLKQKEELIAKMEEQMKELQWQRDVAQSQVETLLKSTVENRSSRMDERSMLSSMDFDSDLRRRSYDSIDITEPNIINNLTERNFASLENSEEDDFLLDDNTPQFLKQKLYKDWEEMVQINNQKLEDDACKEVRCIEPEANQRNGQTAMIENRDLVDNIIDKKAVSEVLSPRKEETLSAVNYKQRYNSYMVDEKADNNTMEISTPAEKEHDDVELCLNAKPETYEVILKNTDLEMGPSVEAQESVKEDEQTKKDEREMGPSTKQSEQCSNKEENAQLERQLKEDCEILLPAKKQSEEAVEMDLTHDGFKLDEDAASGEKWENYEAEDRDYNELSVCKNIETDDVDYNTYMALQENVKKMQKKIEYLMSMHTVEQQQSPSFRRDYRSPDFFTTKRSRSCRESLLSVRSPNWFENLEVNNNMLPAWGIMELNASTGGHRSKTSNTSSISFDSGCSTSADARSLKDYSDPETGNSFKEFVAGLEEMARQHHSVDSTRELDNGTSNAPTTETMEIRPESPANSITGNTNALPNSQNKDEETINATNDQSERQHADDLVEEAITKEKDSREACLEKVHVTNRKNSSSSSDFDIQQRQIIELWALCNVPLVHRTYFFLLFKGDPSDYVYMEVELRRLSFLKQTISTGPETSRIQTAKALTREKELLSKQIPKKFPWSQRIELYQKWGVEVKSKQRSLQVANKLWANTQDMEHIKESASLMAKLLGFVESSQMPKEMFGLSLLPRTENEKSSGWNFTKSFSAIRFTGL